VTRALDNVSVGLDPQRNEDQALPPSAIEKDFTETVKHLRENHYPVFPDDVMKWTAEAIEGTNHASYFVGAK